MRVSEELLNRYFKNQCSPEEKLLVKNYLANTEELPEHFLSKEEWDDAADACLTDIQSKALFDAVKRETVVFQKPRMWKKVVAIAAVIAIICTAALWLYHPATEEAKLSAVKIKAQRPPANYISWKSVVNYTDQVQDLMLPDKSIVKIFPAGEVRYAIPFVQSKREIYLMGKGFFEVSKDKQHPFIVYAGGISTTALGTSFTISVASPNKLVSVKLHTGKVWVRDADSTHQVMAFNEILTPGKELVYNSIKKEIKIRLTETAPARKEMHSEMQFTQAPLTEVFAKLQSHYKIKIEYNAADLKEMSFTGTLKVSQPANLVLKEITELNKLNQIQTKEGYLIRR